LAQAVARYYFKLLAIKDEYEVARLYAETDFLDKIAATFEGDYTLHFHLAPPLLARPDPVTGVVNKIEFGSWMMGAFRYLAKLRRMRGTRWDIFSRSAERKLEQQLISDYEADLALILNSLSIETLEAAVELASLPEQIRGFGHVKRTSVTATRVRREALRERFDHFPA
jgi:indolepyruvate ferredoxin oxidoreductase